eukprot:m.356078 g.356078  ORF g.356078 m.356078 type:complete len:184 (-) comp19928_c0_seq11:43-594(-)
MLAGLPLVSVLVTVHLCSRHGVRGQVVHRYGANAGEEENMQGCLQSTIDKSKLQCWPTDKRFNDVVDQGPSREGDVLPVRDILKAAGVTLEDVGAEGPFRFAGITIVVYIDYSTSGTGSSLSYKYLPRKLSNTEYKLEEQQFPTSTQRKLFNRHALNLVFVQTGVIGEFDFLVLMVRFASTAT